MKDMTPKQRNKVRIEIFKTLWILGNKGNTVSQMMQSIVSRGVNIDPRQVDLILAVLVESREVVVNDEHYKLSKKAYVMVGSIFNTEKS